ncbi:hypothetical protein PUN28_005329 [Cardiocondyla obscurior]|uniref:Uncharacterized protein n=1 Tax=Cardiocondyla obscurior TaxID=286306 RepID=A0AAW2GJ92_9HYME
MVLTKKLGRLSNQFFQNKPCSYTAVRCFSDKAPWNYIWEPKEYSKKDHDKIAEKYHLHPKEYQPYPNNERFIADYPKLPLIGPAAKDPYYPYDIPLYKKNYHETLHDRFETMGEDRFSFGVKPRVNLYLATAIYFATMFGGVALFLALESYHITVPRLGQQMPKKGVVHYSFEPADS